MAKLYQIPEKKIKIKDQIVGYGIQKEKGEGILLDNAL